MFAVDQTHSFKQGGLPGSHTLEVMATKPTTIWGFQTAKSLPQVVKAWRLVYHVYLESGYITPNPYKIHTVPQAVQPATAVFLEQTGPCEGSTLSAILDGPKGLPLDHVYGDELDKLRNRGRRLLEFGLLADTSVICDDEGLPTRKHNPLSARYPMVARMGDTLANVFRHAFWYAMCNDVTDIVIGVNPKHAPFYQRVAGFRRIARNKTYSLVNNAPVTLLRCALDRRLNSRKHQPEGLAYCLEYPPVDGAFDDRCAFTPREVRGSVIDVYLRYRHRMNN